MVSESRSTPTDAFPSWAAIGSLVVHIPSKTLFPVSAKMKTSGNKLGLKGYKFGPTYLLRECIRPTLDWVTNCTHWDGQPAYKRSYPGWHRQG